MSLMSHTVTVYRPEGTREVLRNCSFQLRCGEKTDHLGTQLQNRFTLILRGSANIKPGDRIMEGVGPELDFDSVLPELLPAYRVAYVQPFFWGGRVSHMEVGG